jgi:hypothetical protein
MKRIKYILNNTLYGVVKKVAISFLLLFILFSCDENEFLKEVPLDFLSPENSYVTYEDYVSAITKLHAIVRDELWGQGGKYEMPRLSWYGTDLILTYFDTEGSQDYKVLWGPQGEQLDLWAIFYRLIYDANVIIGRSQSEFSELNSDQKKLIEAEARFFRGYAYAMLAHLWGGVPIVLEETTSPKKDYIRASRKETYDQSAADLKVAADNLPDIDKIDESRINKLAASHVLSEVYISLGRWQDAVAEASKVIDHPGTDLMTKRFGSRVNETAHPVFPWARGAGKDVYWDLFQPGNQDRAAGNTESIWVLQFKYLVPGGGDGGYLLERFVGPYITRAMITQSNGKTAAVCYSPSTYYMGRSQGFAKPSPYFLKTIWEKSGWDVDIRNAPYNIVRDIKVNNPNNQYHGKWVIADKLPVVKKVNEDTMRYYYPMIIKVSPPEKHPLELWDPNQTIPGTLLGTAQQTFRKHYMIRLAETYLLRAEAYLGMGDKTKAAADINAVRRRANAPDVNPTDVDIDYIMDEQLRELHYETLRIFTMGRLGKFVDRVKRVNPIAGAKIGNHQNLWAIPFSEINKNTGATLEQNPGY